MNFSSLLLSFAISAGMVSCGGSVETSGSAHTGGTGGTAGSGGGGVGAKDDGGASTGGSSTGGTGAGGAGGTTTPMSTCTPQDDISPVEQVGFTADGPLPDTMTITFLSPTEIGLEGPNGASATFRWGGPDLTGYFLDGEAVQVSGEGTDWHVVSHAGGFFAAHYAAYFGSSGGWAPVPFGGPTLDLAWQCTDGSSDYSAIVASLGPDQITVPGHETGTLGAFEIHNGGIYDWTSISDYGFAESVSVRGPIPPPP